MCHIIETSVRHCALRRKVRFTEPHWQESTTLPPGRKSQLSSVVPAQVQRISHPDSEPAEVMSGRCYWILFRTHRFAWLASTSAPRLQSNLRALTPAVIQHEHMLDRSCLVALPTCGTKSQEHPVCVTSIAQKSGFVGMGWKHRPLSDRHSDWGIWLQCHVEDRPVKGAGPMAKQPKTASNRSSANSKFCPTSLSLALLPEVLDWSALLTFALTWNGE
jgi:hypothetical protein